MQQLIDQVMQMRHSPLRNYIVPGLTSWLVGPAPSDPARGCVRLFEMERMQDTKITPHSHRFGFTCLVLRGRVYNTLFTQGKGCEGSAYKRRILSYAGEPGKYVVTDGCVSLYERSSQRYVAGETYGMRKEEIHMIEFSKDALVLFFEGPSTQDNSVMLLPYVNGEVIDTSIVQPWMFKKDPQ